MIINMGMMIRFLLNIKWILYKRILRIMNKVKLLIMNMIKIVREKIMKMKVMKMLNIMKKMKIIKRKKIMKRRKMHCFNSKTSSMIIKFLRENAWSLEGGANSNSSKNWFLFDAIISNWDLCYTSINCFSLFNKYYTDKYMYFNAR